MSWNQPKEADWADDRVVGALLPPLNDIPAEFKNHNNKWCDKARKLFFSGGKMPQAKDGVDANLAAIQISSILMSFQPEHNHKIYGVAYLMSLFYEDK